MSGGGSKALRCLFRDDRLELSIIGFSNII